MSLLATIGSIGLAGAALLTIGWAIIRFFVERPFHDLAEMHNAIKSAANSNDPLEHLYRAMAYERLARRYLPSRREFLVLMNLWLWVTLAVSPWAFRDIAIHFIPVVELWVILLLTLLVLFFTVYLAAYFLRELVRNIAWATEALHLRITDLVVESRRNFMEAIRDVPERKPSGLLRTIWQSTSKPREWKALQLELKQQGEKR